MRPALFLFCAAIAAPASAEPVAREMPGLTDPAIADQVADMARALSDALLDINVGALKAAAEGRTATAEEKRLTVRDLGRRENPDFERRLDSGIAAAGPAMKAGMDAIAQSLPALAEAAQKVEQAVARAASNLPDPTYPRR